MALRLTIVDQKTVWPCSFCYCLRLGGITFTNVYLSVCKHDYSNATTWNFTEKKSQDSSVPT